MEIVRNDSFHQKYQNTDSDKYKSLRHSIQYPTFLSNSGILNGYNIVNIKMGDVLEQTHSNYRGEVYLMESQGSVLIDYFSPNKIVVDVRAEIPDVLAVNQNYYIGWRVRKNGKTTSAKSYNGLISTPVEAGHQKIIFYYLPVSALIGFFVTGAFIAFSIIKWQRT